METLQTIWTVLTSENEKLAEILFCPLFFIEAYLYMLAFLTLLKVDCTKKQKIIFTISFSITAIINILFISDPYYTFVNVIAFPILALIIFKLNKLQSILGGIVVYFSLFLIVTPLVLLYSYITKIPSTLISTIPLHRLIYSIMFYILIYCFCMLCEKFNINLSRIGKIKKFISPTLIINLLIGTLAIAVQFFIEKRYIDYMPIHLVIISLLVLITYFIISIISLFRTSKLESTTEKLEQEQLYNKTLGLLYDNIRGFKHDFNNIVQGIGGYISTNNMEGLKEYYAEILDDCQRVNNLSLLSPEVINNPALYSLLASKYHDATEFGIKINIEVFMDLSNINMRIYELTRALGILLDNAIEASKECEEKQINVTMRLDKKANKQLFIIENTYLNKDVNIDEIFEKGKTSKASNEAKSHGLGLWEVRNLVKKRKNIDLYTTKNDIYFKQQFEVYCQKK